MIEINELTFWGLCGMAGIGFLQAAAHVFSKNEEKPEDWTKPKDSPPGEAPEGFRWVLVRDEDIAPKPTATKAASKVEIENRWNRLVTAEKAKKSREK